MSGASPLLEPEAVEMWPAAIVLHRTEGEGPADDEEQKDGADRVAGPVGCLPPILPSGPS